jgi:hypothetical protein
MGFCWQIATAGVAPQVYTDKDIYNQGEMIKVNFMKAPGIDTDWICIVPAGSSDTETEDYKYIPKGLNQGTLIFDPHQPGEYEARAYYNYRRKGYIVSGRHTFSVVSDPAAEAAMAQRIERKIDPNNPLEANLPPEKGIVYIFQEYRFLSSGLQVPIKTDGKTIVVMANSSYYFFSVPAGSISFTTGDPLTLNVGTMPAPESKIIVKVKPGYAYYLKLEAWSTEYGDKFLLTSIPPQEGANIIKSQKLNQIKR